MKCYFEGHPRPQITWYKHGSNLKTFNHAVVETLQDNGIFKVITTLDVPGCEAATYFCSGNNSLRSGWSSSKKEGVELLLTCKQYLCSSVGNNWQFKKRRQLKGATPFPTVFTTGTLSWQAESIAQNMVDIVFTSRQALIVLSNNYLASNFCREELHMVLRRH